MRTILRCGVFPLFIWMVSIIGGIHFPANPCRAQHEVFEKSVIQRWREYENFSRSIQGTVRWTSTTKDGKVRTDLFRYRQNPECALVIVPGREPGMEKCALANPLYSARIKRSTADASNAVLETFDPRSKLDTDKDVRTAIDGVFSGTSPHFMYAQTRLSHLVLSPSFQVIKVTRETYKGRELVQVDHIYTHDIPGSNKTYQERLRGSLFFDPSRCWCLRRSKNTREGVIGGEKRVDSELDVEYETIDHPSGFPIIKTATQHSIQFIYKTKKKSEHTSKAYFDLEVKEGPSNEEFTLSAFGLPEPGSEPVKKPMPMYVWILVAALGSFGLAVVFRYFAHRLARSQPSA